MTHDLYIVLSIASSLDHFTDQFQEIEVDTEIPQFGILKLTSGLETQPEVMSEVREFLAQLGFGLLGDNKKIPSGYIIRNILVGGSGDRFLRLIFLEFIS